MNGNIVKVILGAAVAIGLTLPMGISTSADKDWGAPCRARLDSAKGKLDHDIARHGSDSRQADHDRDQLEAARQWCRDHHADWDHATFDVGVYLRR
jgi:hypothetical protein